MAPSESELAAFARLTAEAMDASGLLVLAPDSNFKECKDWDSIASVSIVAMIYAEFDVQTTGDELVGCETVTDLAKLVWSKRVGNPA